MERKIPIVGGVWDGNTALVPLDSGSMTMDLPGHDGYRALYVFDPDLMQWNYVCEEKQMSGGTIRLYGCHCVIEPAATPNRSLFSIIKDLITGRSK